MTTPASIYQERYERSFGYQAKMSRDDQGLFLDDLAEKVLASLQDNPRDDVPVVEQAILTQHRAGYIAAIEAGLRVSPALKAVIGEVLGIEAPAADIDFTPPPAAPRRERSPSEKPPSERTKKFSTNGHPPSQNGYSSNGHASPNGHIPKRRGRPPLRDDNTGEERPRIQ